MLTKADDFPIHQTPDVIAFSGSDRNFYDRYFFNGYGPDGEDFFALSFGVYPVANVADAHFGVIRGDVEHCLHASRMLDMERLDLVVGPITIEVIEPLKRLRLVIDAPAQGMFADLVFEGRAFPLQEPRFIQRIGPRVMSDYTRMTQNGRWTGWIEVDGDRRVLAPGAMGSRDRSWGVRPIGGVREVPIMPKPVPAAILWRWCPTNFADFSLFFHIQHDLRGGYCTSMAAMISDGGTAESFSHSGEAEITTPLQPGTRFATSATLVVRGLANADITVAYEPVGHRFFMRGIGYFHPDWPHGLYKGVLVVEREDIVLTQIDPLSPANAHIQAVARATLHSPGQPDRSGIGVIEQIILGPYAPLGFTGIMDPAP
jgi:hypothetical protein